MDSKGTFKDSGSGRRQLTKLTREAREHLAHMLVKTMFKNHSKYWSYAGCELKCRSTDKAF